MKAPLLDGRRHDEAAEEEEVGFQEVLRADLLGREDSQRWEEADGKHGRHSQRKSLRAPKHGHEHDDVQTFPLLEDEHDHRGVSRCDTAERNPDIGKQNKYNKCH